MPLILRSASTSPETVYLVGARVLTYGVACTNLRLQCGDSAVVSVGSSVGIVGTGATYPHHNTISNNHMHEIGICKRSR